MRVFYEAPPAMLRYFDPYIGTGVGTMNLMDTFGWDGYSPAGVDFLLEYGMFTNFFNNVFSS